MASQILVINFAIRASWQSDISSSQKRLFGGDSSYMRTLIIYLNGFLKENLLSLRMKESSLGSLETQLHGSVTE